LNERRISQSENEQQEADAAENKQAVSLLAIKTKEII
jgi:hypothetical protein